MKVFDNLKPIQSDKVKWDGNNLIVSGLCLQCTKIIKDLKIFTNKVWKISGYESEIYVVNTITGEIKDGNVLYKSKVLDAK